MNKTQIKITHACTLSHTPPRQCTLSSTEKMHICEAQRETVAQTNTVPRWTHTHTLIQSSWETTDRVADGATCLEVVNTWNNVKIKGKETGEEKPLNVVRPPAAGMKLFSRLWWFNWNHSSALNMANDGQRQCLYTVTKIRGKAPAYVWRKEDANCTAPLHLHLSRNDFFCSRPINEEWRQDFSLVSVILPVFSHPGSQHALLSSEPLPSASPHSSRFASTYYSVIQAAFSQPPLFPTLFCSFVAVS